MTIYLRIQIFIKDAWVILRKIYFFNAQRFVKIVCFIQINRLTLDILNLDLFFNNLLISRNFIKNIFTLFLNFNNINIFLNIFFHHFWISLNNIILFLSLLICINWLNNITLNSLLLTLIIRFFLYRILTIFGNHIFVVNINWIVKISILIKINFIELMIELLFELLFNLLPPTFSGKFGS
jgi:hypothetical protein